jgi:type IV pilus assembly protein PilV
MFTVHPRAAQSGGFLLEALIAILIFSFGILGIVGLQAQSIRYVNDSQYRGEASFMVNSYLSKMWAGDRSTLAAEFGDPSALNTSAEDFKKNMVSRLPGAAAIKDNPTIVITDGPAIVGGGGGITLSSDSSLATVTVWWLLPGEVAAAVDPTDGKGHKFTGSAIIGRN